MSDNLIEQKRIQELLYEPGTVINPFSKEYNKIIFADDTATGKPCKLIDKLIESNVYPFYANTHSNATCGMMMKDLVNKTKDIIRQHMNVSDNQKIIFCGNGCTCAVNHLVNKINFLKYKKICIHTSFYEHHSNFLPWKEKLTEITNLSKLGCESIDVKYNYIDSNSDFEILTKDYVKKLDLELNISNDEKKLRLDIFTLTGCSNVTGKRYDLSYNDLWTYIKNKKSQGYNMYLLIDYACCAPYIKIDMQTCDGIFFSGHKFLGGTSTPGVLIVNQELLQKNHPYEPGGGCVDEANDLNVVYKKDIESREMCGTPNITGIIRLGYVLNLKQSLLTTIEHNEKFLANYITNKMKELEAKYDNFKVIGLNNRTNDDLPIFPITIKGLHHNLITIMLNDLYGIQTRGGFSCCGTFGRMCKMNLGINGWCRISFSYLLSFEESNKILDAIEYIINNNYSLQKHYKCYVDDIDMFHYVEKNQT